MGPAEIFLNGLGILGTLLLLFGFYRVNIGKWSDKSFWYELDNLLGAIFLITYQLYYHAYVTVVANAIWGAIALYGLVTFIRRAHRHRTRSYRQKKHDIS